MTDSCSRFVNHIRDGTECLQNYDETGHDFALRYVWIVCVSAFDLFLTELISEVGLRLIDREPPILTTNLRLVDIPLGNALDLDGMAPSEKLVFFQNHIFSAVQYKSFYKPEKVSEALSYIWTCPAKEKWTRIFTRMRETGRYEQRTEEDARNELTLIGDRRDLIAHAMDIPPGTGLSNPVARADAERVIEFIFDLGVAIDAETESQLKQ